MLGRQKLLLLIPAILLIPILLGMTPLTMAHRLASGGPFTHAKQCCWDNHCPFHSIVSHDTHFIATLNSTPLGLEITPAFYSRVLEPGFVHVNIIFNSIPLRC
jgi:hypothetical protein